MSCLNDVIQIREVGQVTAICPTSSGAGIGEGREALYRLPFPHRFPLINQTCLLVL